VPHDAGPADLPGSTPSATELWDRDDVKDDILAAFGRDRVDLALR
jgi:hypothetical protein